MKELAGAGWVSRSQGLRDSEREIRGHTQGDLREEKQGYTNANVALTPTDCILYTI